MYMLWATILAQLYDSYGLGADPNVDTAAVGGALQGLGWIPVILGSILALVLFVLILVAGGYLLLVWYRHKDREEKSLGMVCLQVAVPRDNEIKIDAMEQVFSSLASIKKGGRGPFGWFSFLDVQPHISFELVARKEDIRFFIVVPDKLRDLVEKQIHGSYPGAEIKIVEEPTIFAEEGKVEFSWLALRTASFNPINVYKNLAVDPMAAMTSALAKMSEGEGAHIQILIFPADNKWKGKGRAWIGKTKKNESYGAIEASNNGKYFTAKNPITTKLPYNDPYYTIGYTPRTDGGVDLTISTPSPRYRFYAVEKIRELGYDPTDFVIVFKDFKNPLGDKK
jgi:hypothetical protein